MLRYINIGDNSFIPTYNLLVGIGIALAMLYLQYDKDFKQKNETQKYKIHLSLLLSVIGGFIGAFIFDAYTQNIEINFANLNKIGLTFFAGFVFGLILFIAFLKIFSFQVLQTLNQLTIPFCIAQFVGRLGCFFAGCCYGTPTNSIFGVVFPIDSLPHNHYNQVIKIHPTQLYESFFALSIFILLSISKSKNQFFAYIFSYSVFRFLIEFIRADNRGDVFNQSVFSPSQLISIFTAFITMTFILTRKFSHTQTIKI